MKIPIDRDLITDQMNTLGLSERTIISRTGVPSASFRKARQEGLLESSLSLRHLYALADILGVYASEILARTEKQPTGEPTATASEDAATLIPLLLQVPRMVAVDQLGRTLGWDRSRLSAALSAIPSALSDTGLRLHTSQGKVKVLASTQTDKRTQQALVRLRTSGNTLNKSEAAVLSRVINGENVVDRMISNPTRVAIGSLKNMGCIALDADGVFTVTDELKLALPDI